MSPHLELHLRVAASGRQHSEEDLHLQKKNSTENVGTKSMRLQPRHSWCQCREPGGFKCDSISSSIWFLLYSAIRINSSMCVCVPFFQICDNSTAYDCCMYHKPIIYQYIWLDMSMGVRVTCRYGLRLLVHIREKWGHGEIGEDQIWRPPGLMVGWGHRDMHGCWRRSCHGHRRLSYGKVKRNPRHVNSLCEKSVKIWMKTHISNQLHEYELSCRKVSSEIVLLGQKFKLPIANAGPSTLTRLQNHSKCRNDLEPRKPWGCEALTQTQHNTTSDN